ncbi:retinol-binding protein pinta-like [Diabrotica virgifera virgifera]|uniref:Retinol-binding protein pinta-like isoform X1 n=1 Tax=Diabrotica virgifera virgifera TaxID=50390 RepID=A0A6P7GMT9_DIAVI|nr:retinol-binding protein pinta-like [Diabrotica virgifera virgifera]
MGSSDLLMNDREKVLQAFEKTEKDLAEDVIVIKEWIKSQPHLPEVPSTSIIESFLVTNKFSIEKTKNKLDMYYSIRTMIPECFKNSHPNLPHMIEITKYVQYIPLPKLTKDMFRVNISKLSGNPKYFDVYNFFAHQININEIRLHEELILGDVLLVDLKDVSLGHMVKVTPQHIKKAVLVLEKVFSNRIKQIHLVNPSTSVDMLVSVLKSTLKQKLADRIQVHNNIETLLNHMSSEILPKEYGGTERPVAELQELWKQKLQQYGDRFDKLELLKVNEKLRPTPLHNDEVLGYYGNFKTISVD